MDSAEAYEFNAYNFLRGRDDSPIGWLVVEEWARTLPRGATVIELACGGGYPITRVLIDAGLQLWAIDSSPTLVATFKSRFPNIPIQCARVQETDFFHRQYDAVISIGLLFLLTEFDQTALIFRVAKILASGGRFLFMAPIQIGSWKDLNTGLECVSLGQEHYTALLKEAGFRIVGTYVDKGENNYYDAEKL